MAATPKPYRAKNGDITWHVRYRIDGRSNPVKDTFGPFEGDTDGSRALAAATTFARLVDAVGGSAARATRRTGESSARSTPTLRTWLDRHLKGLEGSATPGTIAEYRRMAERTWLPSLGRLPLDAITREAVKDWVAWQRQQTTNRGRPYSPKSIANAHGLLSAALAAAVDAELVTRNVAKGVDLPSDVERPEMVILTENEFTALLDAMPERWQLLVALLYSTGLRWGEATALQPGDLDLDGVTPVLRVSRAWKKGAAGVYLGAPKTRRGRRTVSLAPQLVVPLRALVEGKASGDLLFTSTEGARVSSQHFHGRVWRPALRRSGLTKRPRVHDLRHTHASLMIAAGMDLLQLQHRLGHESLKVTGDTYGHLMPDAHMRGSAHAGSTLVGAFPQIEAARS